MLVNWGEAVWGIPTERIISLKMAGHLTAKGQGSCKKFVKNSRIGEPDMLVRTRACIQGPMTTRCPKRLVLIRVVTLTEPSIQIELEVRNPSTSSVLFRAHAVGQTHWRWLATYRFLFTKVLISVPVSSKSLPSQTPFSVNRPMKIATVNNHPVIVELDFIELVLPRAHSL